MSSSGLRYSLEFNKLKRSVDHKIAIEYVGKILIMEIDMNNNIDLIKKNIKRHGVKCALYQVTLTAINKVIFFNIITCVVISKVKQKALEIDDRFEHGFLDKDKLINYSIDKEYQLQQEFLQSAITKGDECYAITDNGKLAGYGWYSNKETLTDLQQLKFCFDPSYVFMYKGFTREDYRGQRLHAVGMSWALNQYLDKGYNGIVTYVNSANFDSLKSCKRMGYENAGMIYILKVFGKVYHYPSRSCGKYNIKLKD